MSNDGRHSIFESPTKSQGRDSVGSTKNAEIADDEKEHPDPDAQRRKTQPKFSTNLRESDLFTFYDDANPTVSDSAGDEHTLNVKPHDLRISGTADHTDDMLNDTFSNSSELFDHLGAGTDADSDDYDNGSCLWIICCICILVVLFIGALIYINNSLSSSDPHDFTNNPDYPECNEAMFHSQIEPIIDSKVSERMKQQREDWSLRYDAYEMNVDPQIVTNVVQHIYDDNKQMVLVYGAIESHKGTVQLFDAVEERLNEPNEATKTRMNQETKSANESTKTWIYDLQDLTQHKGVVHERLIGLFQRADEWSTQHPNSRLLVVLDHISQPNGKENRAVVWNQLFHFKWKKNPKWKIFVVESDPKMMIVDGDNHGKRIFGKQSHVATVSVPFTGGPFFEKVMKSLTTRNPDIITMNTANWTKLENLMRGFTVEDTFNLYHDAIRTKVRGLEKQSANPIVLEMKEVMVLVEEQNTQFEVQMVQRMESWARSFGQTVYDTKPKEQVAVTTKSEAADTTKSNGNAPIEGKQDKVVR